MTRAVGNGLIKTLADTIGTGAVGKLAKQVAGLSTDVANIKTPDKGSGMMFNPDTGKLYIPCGNGVTVNKNTGMLEVPIGDNLRYTGSGLDVPDADETTAGVVKLTHEVSNRDDGEWAITADGVYAYAKPLKSREQKQLASVNNDLLIGFNPIYYANGIIVSGYIRPQSGTSETNELFRVKGFNAASNRGQVNWLNPDLYKVFNEDWHIRNEGNDFVIYSGNDEPHSINTITTNPVTLLFPVPGNLTI